LLRPVTAIGFLSLATTAYAEPAPVAGDELKTYISGSLVEIDTPLGTKLPVRFGSDGLVSAEAGELAPILGSAKDRGRWWIDGDKVCSKFFRWFDAEVRCITVARDGSRLYWRDNDGETGTATMVEQASSAAQPPAVVAAKAEPRPAKSEAAASPPKEPVSVSKDKAFVTASAAASPAVPSAKADPVAAERPAPARPMVEAESEEAKKAPGRTFGGSELLDASTRVALSPVRPLDKRAATAAPKKETPPRAQQAKPEPSKKAAKTDATVVAKLPTQPRAETASVAEAPARGRAPTASEMFAAREEARAREVALSRSVPAPLYRVRGVQPGDVLNVRRGPSEYHEQIASIPPTGRSVEITGRCRDDWCPVRYGKVRGWVNSYYLTAEGPRVGSSSPVYTAKP
jgi:hypothetical protein